MRDVKLCWSSVGGFAGLVLTSTSALAGTLPTIPEPSVLSLLGLAGVVAAVVAIRRRKK